MRIYRAGNAVDFLRDNAPGFLEIATDNWVERLGYPKEESILYLPGVEEDGIVIPDHMALLVLNVGRPVDEHLMLVTGGSNEEVAVVAKALKHTWVLGNHHGYDIGQLEGGVK